MQSMSVFLVITKLPISGEKGWTQQNTRNVSRDLHILWIFWIPHPWAVPTRPILNKINTGNNYLKLFADKTWSFIGSKTFAREHVGQINFLHVSNSLVYMLLNSLTNMLTKSLVNIVVRALANMLAKPLMSMITKSQLNMMAKSMLKLLPESLAESLVNMRIVWVTDEQVDLVPGEQVGLIFVFFPVYKFLKIF